MNIDNSSNIDLNIINDLTGKLLDGENLHPLELGLLKDSLRNLYKEVMMIENSHENNFKNAQNHQKKVVPPSLELIKEQEKEQEKPNYEIKNDTVDDEVKEFVPETVVIEEIREVITETVIIEDVEVIVNEPVITEKEIVSEQIVIEEEKEIVSEPSIIEEVKEEISFAFGDDFDTEEELTENNNFDTEEKLPENNNIDVEKDLLEEKNEEEEEYLKERQETHNQDIQNDIKTEVDLFSFEEMKEITVENHAQETKPQTIAEKLSSVSDTVASHIAVDAKDTVADIVSKEKISNLKLAIGINDKFFFINKLFFGEVDHYNEMIEKFNNFTSLNDAKILLQMLINKYGWNLDDEAFKKFEDVIERRY